MTEKLEYKHLRLQRIELKSKLISKSLQNQEKTNNGI